MDLVDIISQKSFLGQEFLTWLWYKSDERGGTVLLPGAGDVQVEFEKHMVLESGEGEAHERLICRGLQTELQEARTGLLMGKKLEQARIRLASGDYEWHLTLSGTLMEVRNLKLPKTMTMAEEAADEGGFEGRILERIGFTEHALQLITDFFRMFLAVRIGPDWEAELVKIRAWVHHGDRSH